MGLEGSPLHQQHHIMEEAALPEDQQTVQEALKMGRTPELLPTLATRGARRSAPRAPLPTVSHGPLLLPELPPRVCSPHARLILSVHAPPTRI